MNRSDRTTSRGMTLIELMVVISILFFLVAMTIPAVQGARDSSRRLRCATHLKRIGLAASNYAATYNVFPNNNDGGTISGDFSFFSAFTSMLPYLDQPALAQAVNFERDNSTSTSANPTVPDPANATVAATVLDVLLCPADYASNVGPWAGANYRINKGVLEPAGPDRPFPREGHNGASPPFAYLSPAQFRDGLSNTAFFSEKTRGRAAGKFDLRTGYWFNSLILYTTVEEQLAACAMADDPHWYQNDVGNIWFLPTYRFTQYNHNARPNSGVPDCAGPWNGFDPAQGNGLFSARSQHPGGVQVLYADGHVSFATSQHDLAIWRALGTRSGGETITGLP